MESSDRVAGNFLESSPPEADVAGAVAPPGIKDPLTQSMDSINQTMESSHCMAGKYKENEDMLKEVYKVYKNNPPHLFRPHSKYMVTGGTYLKRMHLIDSDSKERLLLSILKGCQKYGWKLEEWVILNNHYHLILDSPENADSLSQLINSVHRFTSIWIRKNKVIIFDSGLQNMESSPPQADVAGKKSIDTVNGLQRQKSPEKIFHNYWDSCITYEGSYFARLNYVYFNPVKHGYISHPKDYQFGSYFYRHERFAEELKALECKYPFEMVKVMDDF